MTTRSLAFACCCLLAACTTHADGTQSVNKTAVGAGIGAVAGGVLGNRLDKDKRGRGTAIGAVAGAAAGAGIGYMMDRQEAELRQQLADERTAHAIEVERLRDDLIRLTVADAISFDVDSATVKPQFQPTLARMAEVLRKYEGNRMTVVGHTDSTGSEAYNQGLSERRAAAVRAALVTHGVPGGQLTAVGRGEREPRADNATAAGRRQNRRVEILVRSLS